MPCCIYVKPFKCQVLAVVIAFEGDGKNSSTRGPKTARLGKIPRCRQGVSDKHCRCESVTSRILKAQLFSGHDAQVQPPFFNTSSSPILCTCDPFGFTAIAVGHTNPRLSSIHTAATRQPVSSQELSSAATRLLHHGSLRPHTQRRHVKV